ncbi:ketohexokinase-like [Saccoglossus kowalevskii]|uniref:Ketohexokinase-like n=1 Tax=Saccoglossus kowalevskii TaxID=10224 RepID=A0ABM0MQ98_SACKO|nr:PREDICTED: ketohexokinase-like [Saccoglossus kowalevskii]
MEAKCVLQVGLTCLDIINVLGHYPEEDTDSRCMEQHCLRGGNAGNSSVVLAQLGLPCEYLGTLAKHKLSELIMEDLHHYGVITDHCVYHDNCQVPTSCCIVNDASGSRTIMHSNANLPELSCEDFEKLDFRRYTWIHFEGRNLKEILKMILKVEEYNNKENTKKDKITISVELEKPKMNLHELSFHGDVVFFSKDYAKHFGYSTAESALDGLQSKVKQGAILVCAWGEHGAWAMETTTKVKYHSSTFPPDKVIDTLGAGDTFNAGFIYSLVNKQTISEALTMGCKVAGKKCGQHGFGGIAEGIV